MNFRTKKLRNRLFEIKPQVCSERCVIFTESMKASEGEPIAIRRAKGFYDVMDKMTINVFDDELIVGNLAKMPKASPIFPEYSYEWLIDEFNGKPYYLHERPGDKFYYNEEDKNAILECIDYWKGKSLYENFRKTLPEEYNNAWDAGIIDDTWVSAAGLGNVVINYDEVVKKGLKYYIEKIENQIDALDIRQPGEINKLWFLQAALKGNQAVVNYANRISKECAKKAENETNEVKRKELLKLAEMTSRVPYEPAETFHEAVQAIWILLVAVHLESNGHAFSLGRFDQYVYPLYKKDVDSGIITRDEALEIVEAFFIKCNELNKLRSWPDTAFFLGYQMFINLAVGGQDKHGKDMTNEVSFLCVEACANVRLFTPSVAIKWHENMDKNLMVEALKAVKVHQGGQPAFYNDIIFMDIMKEMGIDEDDCCDWAPVGCIEASIPGKWDFAAKGPWLSVEKVLEVTLNNGIDPATNTEFLPTTCDVSTIDNINDLFNEYKRQLRYFIDMQVSVEHINDAIHIQQDINAFRASLIDDCISRGKDLIDGGSKYSADGGPTAGIISSGDSFAAMEELIFSQKKITMAQMLHALSTNFEDDTTQPTGEQIRLMAKNLAPRFGNDDDKADKWSVKIADFIGSTYRKECKSSRYGKGPVPASYSLSQSPVTGNIAFGKGIGATPDGRKSGDPVNNGISPTNGSEKNGITAAMNSVAKMPSIWFQKGAIFNVRLAEKLLSEDENIARIISLIEVFFKNKGEHVQFNVVDNKVYMDAMENPEDYADLMVRVSGYSALFTSLSPDVQIDVINRTEFSE